MPSSIFLVLEVFSLILTPGEAVVYYVTPTEPPNPDCPGQPCQTLEYYFSHKEEYFNISKINVTILLLGGEHILSSNHAECPDNHMNNCLSKIIITSCGNIIKELEMFEMIGLEPAHDVVVQLLANIVLVNITKSHFTNLTLSTYISGYWTSLNLIGCVLLVPNTKQSSEKTAPADNVTFVTELNGIIFNNVVLYQSISWPYYNFSTTVANSQFNNLSGFYGLSLHADLNDVQELIVINSTFTCNSELSLEYNSVNVIIFNSTIMEGGMNFAKCTVEISGTVLFSNTAGDVMENPSAAYTFISSNVNITGNVTFADNEHTPIAAYSSTTITLSGNNLFLNNSGVNGGAMALYSSTLNIAPNTTVYFYNNTATETGGAIYVGDDIITGFLDPLLYQYRPCFYQLLDYDVNSQNWYNISFHNNSASKGGDHIYGALMHSSGCYVDSSAHKVVASCSVQKYFHYSPKSMSLISSDPKRVCICKNGSQQCNVSHQNITVHPGETFTLSVVVVGADFGTTLGSVHAIFKSPTTTVQLKPPSQYIQGIRDINHGVCSELNYTVFSQNKYEILALTIKQESWSTIEQSLKYLPLDSCYDSDDSVSITVLYTPLRLDITLLPCPLGFQLRGNPPGCDCHPVLIKNNVKCQFFNHTIYLSWNGPLWLDIMHGTGSNLDVRFALAQYCPFKYCKSDEKIVNLQNDLNAQCTFNRAGRLCGGCKENYSLAIGSSHCIQCPNNNNLALLIFFAAAGFLLVVIIGAFNLTVTQGMINGLIFYANIVWTYQRILFSQQVESNVALALRTIMAWLNLDFGIQTCFVKGLNAIHKTWPQYFFILYIWGIAMVVILAANRSTKLTNLLGNRPVPILVTLFLLSYTKLLQISIVSVGFTQINVFGADRNYTLTVWSLDGNYMYCHYPHVLLFIAALLVFLTIWLPYTLVLFSVKWLRKMSHLKLLQWVPKFNPVWDAHLAPLKDKHHYWFGVLLIVRGVLLVILTLTYTVYPKINYIVLLITASLLLFYSNYHGVYKNRLVQLNESFFLLLLILISGTGILEEQTRRIIVYASVGVGLLVFCGMIVGRMFGSCCKKGKIERDFVPANERIKLRQEISDDAQYRDSILDETEPLLGDTEAIQDVATY